MLISFLKVAVPEEFESTLNKYSASEKKTPLCFVKALLKTPWKNRRLLQADVQSLFGEADEQFLRGFEQRDELFTLVRKYSSATQQE